MSTAGVSDRASTLRVVMGVLSIVAAAVGALVADIGFVDTTVAGGSFGLLLWVPSVLVAVVGARVASRGRRTVTCAAVTTLALLVPALVFLRWLVALSTS